MTPDPMPHAERIVLLEAEYRRYYAGFRLLLERSPDVTRLYYPILMVALMLTLDGALSMGGALILTGKLLLLNGILIGACALGGIIMQSRLMKTARELVFRPNGEDQ